MESTFVLCMKNYLMYTRKKKGLVLASESHNKLNLKMYKKLKMLKVILIVAFVKQVIHVTEISLVLFNVFIWGPVY